MTLRRLVTLLSALAVSIAVTLASAAAYVAVHDALRREIDNTLTAQARFVAARRLGRRSPLRLPAPPPRRGSPIPYAQVVSGDGTTRVLGDGSVRLPVDARVRALARARTGEYLSSVRVGGSHLRVLGVATEDGALQLARPMDGMDSVLSRLRLVLAAVCIAGAGLAAGLGRVIGRRLVGPIREVAAAAHHISQTEDLGGVIVRDRGAGIPPEDLEHVFDRFYRRAESRNRPGTGLGLAIVRQVAETHGGSVEARNAPDGGAILSLRLPARPLPTPTETAPVA